jgi:hypothetical protein
LRTTMSGLRCTRGIHTARAAMFACGCRSVRGVRRALGMGWRLLRRLGGSGVGSVLRVR